MTGCNTQGQCTRCVDQFTAGQYGVSSDKEGIDFTASQKSTRCQIIDHPGLVTVAGCLTGHAFPIRAGAVAGCGVNAKFLSTFSAVLQGC